MKPALINSLSVWLGLGRFFCFLFIYGCATGAQWQLGYIPIYLVDMPVTLLYWKLPWPIGEAIIGPLWWCCLPQIVWWIYYKLHKRFKGGRMA